MSTDELLKVVGQLGLAVTLVLALWYTVFVPRKAKDGKRRSSLLVPGWIHDDLVAELERVRRAHEVQLRDVRSTADLRIAEWRALRDDEIVKRADAEHDRRELLVAVNALANDVRAVLAVTVPSRPVGKTDEA